jgi:hypothetical protein
MTALPEDQGKSQKPQSTELRLEHIQYRTTSNQPTRNVQKVPEM